MKISRFSLCFLVFLISNAVEAQRIVQRIDSSIVITDVELYMPGSDLEDFAASSPHNIPPGFTHAYRYENQTFDASAGNLFVRLNGDDSLVFELEVPSEWVASPTSLYTQDLEISMQHGAGAVMHVKNRVYEYDGTGLIMVETISDSYSPVANPLITTAGVSVPVEMTASSLVLAAMFELYNRVLVRMDYAVYMGFFLFVIYIVWRASKRKVYKAA